MPKTRLGLLLILSIFFAHGEQPNTAGDLIKEADRLAWLKAWVRAEPMFAEAERQFALRGDRRNELYARIGKLRGQLPRLPALVVSQRLSEYLEDPIVQTDFALRLRCLVVKGETDEDIDPALAEQAWKEALELAQRMGEPAWANRARGELGIVAALQGDINAGIVGMMGAVRVAESNGDIPSQVRWQTIFGRGLVEFGKPDQALALYDKALAAASKVPELQPAVMTLVAKGAALSKLGRYPEAEKLLQLALASAEERGALGYQAELLLSLGVMAYQQNQPGRAVELLDQASTFARKAGGNRVLAEIAMELGKIQVTQNLRSEAEKTLTNGVEIARAMNDRVYLPKLLTRLAQVKASQGLSSEAGELLAEASDLLEGLFSKISSPWVRGQLIGMMDEVFTARIQLEGTTRGDANRMFAVVEQVRGRSLAELLLSRSDNQPKKSPELIAGERQIANLQRQLFLPASRSQRRRTLDEILLAEARLSPLSTEFLMLTRKGPAGKPVTLRALQSRLRADEVFLEFALSEPESYCIVATANAARLQRLPGRSKIQAAVAALLTAINSDSQALDERAKLYELLLSQIGEIESKPRLIVVPDGNLNMINLEALIGPNGRSLLESHVVSYSHSGRVMQILRSRTSPAAPSKAALAISPGDNAPTVPGVKLAAAVGTVPRGVYDLELAKLPPLPSANDEARLVAAALGEDFSTVLVAGDATEGAVKSLDLSSYRVIHFATHGIISSKYPDRSALLLRPGGSEDGLFQAREIMERRLSAQLVTLSACETGSGKSYGQEGVSSLMSPFLAAGATAVVANLWNADDTFSLALMREFYRRLGTGEDKGEAMRQAKLEILKRFGPRTFPKLWAGVVMYGESVGGVMGARRAAK